MRSMADGRDSAFLLPALVLLLVQTAATSPQGLGGQGLSHVLRGDDRE